MRRWRTLLAHLDSHFSFMIKNLPSRFLSFAALLAAASVAVSASSSELFPVGGLSELARAAIDNNPGLAAQRSSLTATEQDEDVARAPLLPQVNAGVSKILETDGDSGNERDVNLSLTQQLFNLPLWTNYLSRKQQVRGARLRYANQEQSLRLSVIATWLDLHLAGDVARLTEARIALAKEQLARARSFAEAGVGTAVDVLDAEARLASLRADLLQHRHDWRLVQDRLYNISGMRGREERLKEESLNDFPPLAPLGEWLMQVGAGSFVASAARADLEAAELFTEAALSAIYPRIALSFRVRTKKGLSDHEEDVALSAEQPLFTGGQATAEARRAEANLDVARKNLLNILRDEELRARELHGSAALSRSRGEALTAAEEAAAAALAATSAGYEGGVRVIADVLDAEETLFDARIQLRRTHYAYLRDLASLQALAGAADESFVESIGLLFGEEKSSEGES